MDGEFEWHDFHVDGSGYGRGPGRGGGRHAGRHGAELCLVKWPVQAGATEQIQRLSVWNPVNDQAAIIVCALADSEHIPIIERGASDRLAIAANWSVEPGTAGHPRSRPVQDACKPQGFTLAHQDHLTRDCPSLIPPPHPCDFTESEMMYAITNVCGVGAGLHPQGSAEGGAEVAVCEGNSQGTQPGDRASSVSPRYLSKGRPIGRPFVVSHSLNVTSLSEQDGHLATGVTAAAMMLAILGMTTGEADVLGQKASFTAERKLSTKSRVGY